MSKSVFQLASETVQPRDAALLKLPVGDGDPSAEPSSTTRLFTATRSYAFIISPATRQALLVLQTQLEQVMARRSLNSRSLRADAVVSRRAVLVSRLQLAYDIVSIHILC